MTLVALTVATASMPGSRPSWSAASRVMKARTRCGPAWISTVAASPSRLTSVITPGNRFRALAAAIGSSLAALGEQARDLARPGRCAGRPTCGRHGACRHVPSGGASRRGPRGSWRLPRCGSVGHRTWRGYPGGVAAGRSGGARERDQAATPSMRRARRRPPSGRPPSTAAGDRARGEVAGALHPGEQAERRTAHGFGRSSRDGGVSAVSAKPMPTPGEHEPCREHRHARPCPRTPGRRRGTRRRHPSTSRVPWRSPRWPAGMLVSVAATL